MDPALPGRIDRQAAAIPELRSVLVVRGGYLVVGRYYGGATATAHQPVFSVTKSVTSALVGIALREGHLHSCSRPSGSCWPTSYRPMLIPAWPRSPSSSC
jgi:CubicO group peptidase (beta-lactamase class C family)